MKVYTEEGSWGMVGMHGVPDKIIDCQMAHFRAVHESYVEGVRAALECKRAARSDAETS